MYSFHILLNQVKVDNEKKFESVYSNKVRAGKRRTYFFDVRKTKGDDFYVTLTESTKRFNGDGYERHKIFLYKEDFNRFAGALDDVINHVKTELMPDYDYDEYTRRQEEWEEMKRQEALNEQSSSTPSTESAPESESATESESTAAESSESPAAETTEGSSESSEGEADKEVSEDDLSW